MFFCGRYGIIKRKTEQKRRLNMCIKLNIGDAKLDRLYLGKVIDWKVK